MKRQLEAIKNQAMEKLARVSDIRELEDLKVAYLGKKGELTGILKKMGALSPEERPVIGQLANEVRFALEESIAQTKDRLIKEERSIRLKSETIDVTMPGRIKPIGKKHPLTIVLDELKDIFLGMGYEIAEGPEIELDYNNFEALNIPKNHPARDTQDTFYISENVVLRTHTSPVQIRHMQSHKPPIRIICPGRVYRSDAVDATHSPVFHQVEGLVVDKNVTMGDLVGTLQAFAKGIFGENSRIRLRPHHFPFTEPSAEVDVSCWGCDGSGCRICKGEGWVEILGSGMVHPNVLRECGIDPDVYSGFAFGMGIERIAMGKFGIDDMRLLFENDIRFLRQF
ncbi:MAG: phenylalanine--tRNA ligase subunit alpha [Clostridiaceae bacterium]|jgi:phenylalanyl-tRNA synthetase alpha chain|nr:phenylalanine--tRNA ligase subunit alpha [Clostridiaceae bacterium]